MSLEDVFGNNPLRPNSPQFWRLSNIILKLDGRMDAATTEDEKEKVWEDNVARWVDSDVLGYMAVQRSMRATGARTVADVKDKADRIALCSTVWMEGFQVGSEFSTQPLNERPLEDLSETGLRLLLTHYERHAKESHSKGIEPQSVIDFYNSFHLSEEEE